MLQLPLPERYLFWGILISSVASAILGYVQLVRQAPGARRWLIVAVAGMIALSTALSATPRTFLTETAAAGQKSRPKPNSCEISGGETQDQRKYHRNLTRHHTSKYMGIHCNSWNPSINSKNTTIQIKTSAFPICRRNFRGLTI